MLTKSAGFSVFHCAAIDVISVLPALPAGKSEKTHRYRSVEENATGPETEAVHVPLPSRPLLLTMTIFVPVRQWAGSDSGRSV